METSNKKLLLGVLVGAGLGMAAAYYFSPTAGARRRAELLDTIAEILDRLQSPGRDASERKDFKTERVSRKMADRIERFRSAGM